MSNYSIVANSVFKPFSYQELVAPVLHQQQVHDALADEYDKLSEKADLLEAMGHNEKDKNSPAYAQYKAYSDRLRAEADELYRNGLNSESRMRLSQLRKMYNTDIVPIQNAWTKREVEAQMQAKARMDAAARGVDIRFSRDAANSTLQSYLENPNQTFKIINGNQIAAEVANQFKGLASQVQLDKNGNPWIGKTQLSPIEYRIITQKGMDFNQFQDFINNPDDPNFANIKGIINNTLAAHSINEFDPQTQKEMFRQGAMGVSAGVGARDFQFHIDPYAQDQLNFSQQVALENLKAKHELEKQQLAASAGDGLIAPFDTSTSKLPMMGADYSHTKEHMKAMETLGYENKGGKYVYTGKVKVKLNNDGIAESNARDGNFDAVYAAPTGRKTMEVSVFNSNGKVKTRKEFVAQGKTPQERAALNNYFNEMVSAGKTLGVYGKIYSRSDVANAYGKMLRDQTATYADVYNLNYNKNDWNATSKGFEAREVLKYKDGKPIYDSKRVSLGSILDKKNSDKTDIQASAHWTDVDGMEGLIIATVEDGKPHRYFIDAQTIGENNVQEAREFFGYAKRYHDAGDIARERQARANAWSALHRGFTLNNSPQKQDINISLSPDQRRKM